MLTNFVSARFTRSLLFFLYFPPSHPF